MTKGVLVRREGCMWDAEIVDITFKEFCKRLQEFAEEEGGFATPSIVRRYIAGIPLDIWYDENYGMYHPAPSGVCTDYLEILKGMLFICDADEETGESKGLSDELAQKVLAEYKVIDPDSPEMEKYRKELGENYLGFVLMMIGFKEIHYTVWNKEEEQE